jgi:hypothetical protein
MDLEQAAEEEKASTVVAPGGKKWIIWLLLL